MFGWRAALLDRWARRAAERKGALHLPVRLPFEPFFMLMDRIGAGGIRFIVARKPDSRAAHDQRSAS